MADLMSRRGFLKATAAAGLAGTVLPAAMGGTRPAKRPPNIVLIMADDLGYECIGANGSTSYKTPVLDRMAAQGMRFDHCHSQPLCTPSRVQLMTGIYNVRNYQRFGILEKDQVTFAQLLRGAGYATCIVGKWQLEGGPDAPKHFGFDEYCLWQLDRRPPRYANPGLEVNGKRVDYSTGEYGPDVVSDYACDFMRRSREKPFLLYYPMILTHDPFQPTPGSADWDPAKWTGEAKAQDNPRYFGGMVAHMDKIVGKLLRQLDELGLRENTLVLFTGDNGTGRAVRSMLGERGYRGGKGLTTDAGTHVPLIASWPGAMPKGAVCYDLVDFSDFLPTLCQCAGVAVPTELRIDGRSFLPQLQGRKSDPREWIYCWYSRNGGAAEAREFARNHRFKLYRTGEFYDVDADANEKNPLPADRLSGKSKAAKKVLQAVLDRYANARSARYNRAGSAASPE
jgi:arylsulfatase A